MIVGTNRVKSIMVAPELAESLFVLDTQVQCSMSKHSIYRFLMSHVDTHQACMMKHFADRTLHCSSRYISSTLNNNTRTTSQLFKPTPHQQVNEPPSANNLKPRRPVNMNHRTTSKRTSLYRRRSNHEMHEISSLQKAARNSQIPVPNQ